MANFSPSFTFLLMSTFLVFRSINGEVVSSGDGETVLPPECTAEFQAETNHTMCLTDRTDVVFSEMTDQEKIDVVDLHNFLRANVEPSATDLSLLVWDDQIAAVAQKWAKQCITGHDENRRVPSYGIFIGQNAAGGFSNWHDAVMAWYNESQMYKYGEEPSDYLGEGGWKKIGHYTQMVQNNTFRIGCGYAVCGTSGYGRYYICNYGYGQSNIPNPYTAGDRCSACPSTCQNGLCDCGGKMCVNGGELDINTCTCTCNKLYTGDTCQTLNCPERDSDSCWSFFQPEHCTMYSNTPIECPYMCGKCGGPNGATAPPVVTSPFGCTFSGIRASEAECQGFGDAGADTTACASRSGQFTCADCSKYNNVKTEFCPVMCGYCDGPCNGLSCKNGGKLNRATCQCECKGSYSGEQCEIFTCPASDAGHCWTQWPQEYCTIYNNVKDDCPWMCGLCGQAGATPPPVHTSSFGCTYEGQQPSAEECKSYGDNGQDNWACATNGGSFGCNDCTKFYNVKTDYCPVMCGYCAP